MRLFRQIHRTFFDASFYLEVPSLRQRHAVVYVVKLFLAAAIISSVAQTVYLFDNKRGVIGPLCEALGGMEIQEGRLYPNRPLPYEIQPSKLTGLFNRFLDIPTTYTEETGLSVFVDTLYKPQPGQTKPRITLRSSDIVFTLAPDFSVITPYKEVLFGANALQFKEHSVRSFLLKNVFSVFIYMFVIKGLRIGALLLLSICILTLAAYIFKFSRKSPISYFLKLTCFAITPIPVGVILISLADVKIPGAWNILVFASAIVMIRAIMVIAKSTNHDESDP